MKKKESHTFYNYQFKHTAVTITNHPDIQAVDVAEALGILPIDRILVITATPNVGGPAKTQEKELKTSLKPKLTS